MGEQKLRHQLNIACSARDGLWCPGQGRSGEGAICPGNMVFFSFSEGRQDVFMFLFRSGRDKKLRACLKLRH